MRSIFLVLALAGCAAPRAAKVAPPTSAASAPMRAVPSRESAKLAAALDEAGRAITVGNFVVADKQIAAATALAGDDPHLAYVVARVEATRFVYGGDLDHAASAFVAVIPKLAKHPELSDEFWA